MPGKKRNSNKQKKKKTKQPPQLDTFEVYCDTVEAQREVEEQSLLHVSRTCNNNTAAKKADGTCNNKKLLATKNSDTSMTTSPVLEQMATNVSEKCWFTDALRAEEKKKQVQTAKKFTSKFNLETTCTTTSAKSHQVSNDNSDDKTLLSLTNEKERLQRDIRSATIKLRNQKNNYNRMEASLQALGESSWRTHVQQLQLTALNSKTRIDNNEMLRDYEHVKQRKLRLVNKCEALHTTQQRQNASIASGNAELVVIHNMIAEATLRNAELEAVNHQMRLQRSRFPPEERQKIREEAIQLKLQQEEKKKKKKNAELTSTQISEAISVFEHNYGKFEGFQNFKKLVPGLHIVGGKCELLPEVLAFVISGTTQEQGEVKTTAEKEMTTPNMKKNESKNRVLRAAGLSPIGRSSPSASAIASLPPPVAECVICYENPSTRLFVPCGHYCVCGPCALKYHESGGRTSGCPICRIAYTGIIKMYKQ